MQQVSKFFNWKAVILTECFWMQGSWSLFPKSKFALRCCGGNSTTVPHSRCTWRKLQFQGKFITEPLSAREQNSFSQTSLFIFAYGSLLFGAGICFVVVTTNRAFSSFPYCLEKRLCKQTVFDTQLLRFTGSISFKRVWCSFPARRWHRKSFWTPEENRTKRKGHRGRHRDLAGGLKLIWKYDINIIFIYDMNIYIYDIKKRSPGTRGVLLRLWCFLWKRTTKQVFKKLRSLPISSSIVIVAVGAAAGPTAAGICGICTDPVSPENDACINATLSSVKLTSWRHERTISSARGNCNLIDSIRDSCTSRSLHGEMRRAEKSFVFMRGKSDVMPTESLRKLNLRLVCALDLELCVPYETIMRSLEGCERGG